MLIHHVREKFSLYTLLVFSMSQSRQKQTKQVKPSYHLLSSLPPLSVLPKPGIKSKSWRHIFQELLSDLIGQFVYENVRHRQHCFSLIFRLKCLPNEYPSISNEQH